MTFPSWRRATTVAYLDEPPFAIPGGATDRPSGCDMDLAHHVLTTLGVGSIRFVLAGFSELIPGLLDGRWLMTTAMFVTDERAEVIDFSRPIWSATDGFVIRRDDVGRWTSYEAVARARATLAVVTGQVQRRTAIDAGVPIERIVEFPDQEAAAEAIRNGTVDASASTAIGCRAFVERANDPTIAAVADRSSSRAPLGAFGLSKDVPDLRAAVDEVLGRFLGSPEHVALMRRYGFSDEDLAPAAVGDDGGT